ncbi:glycosyltransferase family 2 protein [Desulfonema limicola]|nr:glycosyltransferase family 2 protein [Desulfonema limicola]
MLISIIIPIFNEENNIDLYHKIITDSLSNADFLFEVILVNDGSTDSSQQKLNHLATQDNRFKIIEFRRNFGQTAAIMAGFDFASGEIVVPMDGDLQNDPNDIPLLVDQIKKGYDVCSGWRKDRKDQVLNRKIPSWIANKLISTLSGVKLNDYGCTLKAYKKEIIKGIRLYGEMHRFLPIHASWQGAKIIEIPVTHHPRIHGKSKYGIERTFKVILDLMVVLFFSTVSNKPIYIFGGFGFINIMLSFLSFFMMIYYKFWGGKTFIQTPLPQLVVLFFLMGFISILMGFLAEILMRTYYESQNKPIYIVKTLYNMDKQ